MQTFVNSFTATDAKGNQFVIECYQKLISYKPLRGPTKSALGSTSYMCGTEHVNRIDDETFLILPSGTRVIRSTNFQQS